MQHKDIKITKKTTKVYELIFKKNGAYENITGWSIYFTVKSNMNDSDANAKISKTVTSHSDAVNGKTLITLEATDTDIDAGNYYYSIDWKDDDDQEGVLFQGKLKITESVRKART